MFSTRVISIALSFTAALNILAGAAALLAPDLNVSLLLGPEVTLEGMTLRYHLIVWSIVTVMGVGYAVAARDPENQTALVLCGGLGKFIIAAIWLEMFSSGLGTPLLLVPICVDGCLGVLFTVFAVRALLKK